MKSFYPKEAEIERNWQVVDLEGQTLGRIASQIANILRGKNKPTYTPSVDMGDFVIAINSDKIKLTGNKLDDKMYHHHTGFRSGIRSISAKKLLKKDSTEMIMIAVKGMLPRGPLGRKQLTKLKIYTGGEHPHKAQKPQTKEHTL